MQFIGRIVSSLTCVSIYSISKSNVYNVLTLTDSFTASLSPPSIVEKCSRQRATGNVVDLQTHSPCETGKSRTCSNASTKVSISHLCVSTIPLWALSPQDTTHLFARTCDDVCCPVHWNVSWRWWPTLLIIPICRTCSLPPIDWYVNGTPLAFVKLKWTNVN